MKTRHSFAMMAALFASAFGTSSTNGVPNITSENRKSFAGSYSPYNYPKSGNGKSRKKHTNRLKASAKAKLKRRRANA